jgi:two-component system cell cycle sensor histidine kinase/response regulator CckA
MGANGSAEQQEKLLLLGMQTAHLIHDWNNVLTLLQAQCAELPPSEAAANLAASLHDAAALPRQLLGYLRSQEKTPSVVAIDDWLGVVRRDFRQLLGPRIRFLVHDGAPGAAILVDRHQLRNALLNLVLNARAAIGESGRIVVESAADGPMVLLRVRDDGHGMDEKVRHQLFEPFFSTGTDSHGTGLGLASVKAFVEAHEGSVSVDSAPARGTTFTLRFPLVR